MVGANLIWTGIINEPASFYTIPDLYLRVGPKELSFADIGVGNHQVMTGKPDVFQIELGAGFEKNTVIRKPCVSVCPSDHTTCGILKIT
jgi:hypothetical protein